MIFDLDPATLISRIATLIIALTVHEFAHAFSADRLGDTTPRSYGRLSLNPLRHLDVFGSLMLLVVGFGWAKPVPVNPYALGRRSPAGLMWVSLAGPASNFLLAVLASIPLRFAVIPTLNLPAWLPTPTEFLVTFLFVNLGLMLFNLIPVPPLDGDAIADYLLPPTWGRVLQTIRPYGPIVLMALLFVAPMLGLDIIGWIMTPPILAIGSLLLGVSL